MIIIPTLINEGETIDKTVVDRMGAKGEISSFRVRRVSDNFNIEIDLNGKPRIFRVPRTSAQEQISAGDYLVLATYATEQFIILKPFAFRHRNGQIYFKL